MRTRESVRPEAMADVRGDAEYNLTRAVVAYQRRHLYWEHESGALDDVGLALVLDGSFPLASEVVDLGSGRVHTLDLSTQIVVVDWVTEKTHAHIRALRAREMITERPWSGASALDDYCDTLMQEILRRAGYNALTRPVLLRIGFRDLVRDLDVNEEPQIRVKLDTGNVMIVQLDADDVSLSFSGLDNGERRALQLSLLEVFPGAVIEGTADTLQVRFPLPLTLAQVATLLERISRGLLFLYAHHEPERFHAISELLSIVGRRNSLRSLARADSAEGAGLPRAG